MLLKFSAVYSDSRPFVRPTLTKCDDQYTVEQLIVLKSVNINVLEVLSGSDFSALCAMDRKCLDKITISDLKEQYPNKPLILKVIVRYGQGKNLLIDNEYFFVNLFFFCITMIISVISIYNVQYRVLYIYCSKIGFNNGNAVHHRFVILFALIFNPKAAPIDNPACPICYLFASVCNLKFTGFVICKLLEFQSNKQIIENLLSCYGDALTHLMPRLFVSNLS